MSACGMPGQPCCGGDTCATRAERCCDGTCVDTRTDDRSCGACGTECPDGPCVAGSCTTSCVGLRGACGPGVGTCCGGLACSGGVCTRRTLCTMLGSACSSDEACCTGTSCRAAPTDDACCREAGGACTSSAQCCGRMQCFLGHCLCRSSGLTCSADEDCCEGLECASGTCRPAGCIDGGRPCGSGGGTCCPGLHCGIRRTSVVCCANGGEACTKDGDCCGLNSCVDGRCDCRTNGSACIEDGQCCGTSGCLHNFCAPCTIEPGELCSPSAPGPDCCTEGRSCDNREPGSAYTCCSGLAGSCATNADCCGDDVSCHLGSCCPYHCEWSGECCPGMSCNRGTPSGYTCCVNPGSGCTGVADCCEAYAGVSGSGDTACLAGTCCWTYGAQCFEDGDCCPPFRCVEADEGGTTCGGG